MVGDEIFVQVIPASWVLKMVPLPPTAMPKVSFKKSMLLKGAVELLVWIVHEVPPLLLFKMLPASPAM